MNKNKNNDIKIQIVSCIAWTAIWSVRILLMLSTILGSIFTGISKWGHRRINSIEYSIRQWAAKF